MTDVNMKYYLMLGNSSYDTLAISRISLLNLDLFMQSYVLGLYHWHCKKRVSNVVWNYS